MKSTTLQEAFYLYRSSAVSFPVESVPVILSCFYVNGGQLPAWLESSVSLDI